ncbi:Uncharacterized protein dnl_62680 [Desulfonema limicola]|uniref:DUF932 domain-containing protein n=1 Tax=Desulfonema limicola TaxID=45656 RepID=A0A975GKJ2_9BACT|nr:hypothetical protein [Desulfonema limicola]QTA83848.1 Uncharacterized protein dnl_62680 [Desulfonema limicola]
MTLLAHCDTKRVEESVVLNAPVIDGTNTWNPVHHSELIIALEKSIHNAGMTISKRDYSLSANSMRMFGLWTLDKADSSMAYSIGIRNSMDKSMAIGITAGTRVFVCDNLAFSGDFIQFRRHTKNVLEELDMLCTNAVHQMTHNLKEFADWHRKLRTYLVIRERAELLTFQAMNMGVINPSQFRKFYSLYFDENSPYGDRKDLYGWHEAVTHLLREKNLFSNHSRNRGLNRICNSYMLSYKGFV